MTLRIVIDLILLAVLAWGIYSGRKQGVVNMTITLVALIVALIGGQILSSMYSSTVMPAFEPFVAGLVDNAEEDALADIGYGESVVNLNDLIEQQPEMKKTYCKALYMEMGLHEGRADKIADNAVDLFDSKKISIENAAVRAFSESMLYVFGTILAAILIMILFSAIKNLINLSFHLPNGPKFETVGGIIMGLVVAALVCTLICWFLSFFGGFIGKDTLASTYLGRVFLKLSVLTDWIL